MAKWISFIMINDTGKTKVWEVRSNDTEPVVLGIVG